MITLTKGSIKIEFDCHTEYAMIESLIKALLCIGNIFNTDHIYIMVGCTDMKKEIDGLVALNKQILSWIHFLTLCFYFAAEMLM